MASNIEWTDETWQPTAGCRKVSPGCKHCYAETMAKRQVAMAKARGDKASPYLQVIGGNGRWTGRAITVPKNLADPLHMRKPRHIFVDSMADLFHEDIPNEYIAAVFGVMAACPQHTFQVLTKQAARLPEFFAWVEAQASERVAGMGHGDSHAWVLVDAAVVNGAPDARWTRHPPSLWRWPLPNVWLGVSTEDQATADERIPFLLQVPAAVRFISAEPLIGPLTLRPSWIDRRAARALNVHVLDWVITGGESGHGARPCDVAWLRSLVEQCATAEVACFVKQLGAQPRTADRFDISDDNFRKIDVAGGWPAELQPPFSLYLDDRKGGDPSEWPEDLRARQWPKEARDAG